MMNYDSIEHNLNKKIACLQQSMGQVMDTVCDVSDTSTKHNENEKVQKLLNAFHVEDIIHCSTIEEIDAIVNDKDKMNQVVQYVNDKVQKNDKYHIHIHRTLLSKSLLDKAYLSESE